MASGGFIGGVGQNIAASVCTGVIGAGCVSLGLVKTADPNVPGNWPMWIIILGALPVSAGFGE